MINLEKFINNCVINRDESLFLNDIKANYEILKNKIQNKSVLVIGGAGSIGSSFIKSILPFSPRKLVVVDLNENALAELTRDLRSSGKFIVPEEYVTYPMNYASRTFVKMFKYNNGFDIVANFSAHKHVRSEKDVFSIEELLRNNVINAKKLLDLLVELPPEEYFCVSTDKAANPVNIMGASKRIMEDLIFSYSDIFPVKTARFANVAFSNGSLPDGFLYRIQKRQPLSAPLDVKRYFVSPAESGQICMMACILGNTREIYFPKLNESQTLTFSEIAEDLLSEYGFKSKKFDSDIDAINYSLHLRSEDKEKYYPVHFSASDTSGEKPYEEFFTDDEIVDLETFESLGVIKDIQFPDKNSVVEMLENLENLLDKESFSKEEVVKIIEEYLPNFKHIETGKSLDSKM